ncbi:hypothetical protein LXD69_14420 [Flavobacterium sediminilitoris]|uniref:Holin n=1 Tax=Flavobacterium sediminilitoris TaxID=2024526 RepID=A0ABY4HKL3_9FLAO|nr:MULTISPECIES: hypothetical protein [Flavobacterium]UOX33228.1 hypothetical protein LXD69_14420 [Flavobacterium sediminilitoris]
MKTQFLTTALGTASIGTIEAVQHLPSPTETADLIKILVQVVVALGTIIQLFKKKKETKKQ